jgi:hypothetical protein
MSDPPRLLSEDDPMGRSLLRAWEAEQPSDEARARALALAGVGAGVGLAGASAAKAGVGAIAKWFALGVVAVGVVGGAIAVARHGASPRPTPPRSAASVSVAAPPPPSAPVVVAEAPVAPSAAPVPPPSPPAVKSPRPASSALGEQVLELDRARRALAGGDPDGALKKIDAYESRFPRGALRDEAEVLRVEALLAAGDRVAAGRASDRFLAAHPDSPHAARVRALMGSP